MKPMLLRMSAIDELRSEDTARRLSDDSDDGGVGRYSVVIAGRNDVDTSRSEVGVKGTVVQSTYPSFHLACFAIFCLISASIFISRSA